MILQAPHQHHHHHPPPIIRAYLTLKNISSNRAIIRREAVSPTQAPRVQGLWWDGFFFCLFILLLRLFTRSFAVIRSSRCLLMLNRCGAQFLSRISVFSEVEINAWFKVAIVISFPLTFATHCWISIPLKNQHKGSHQSDQNLQRSKPGFGFLPPQSAPSSRYNKSSCQVRFQMSEEMTSSVHDASLLTMSTPAVFHPLGRGTALDDATASAAMATAPSPTSLSSPSSPSISAVADVEPQRSSPMQVYVRFYENETRLLLILSSCIYFFSDILWISDSNGMSSFHFVSTFKLHYIELSVIT